MQINLLKKIVEKSAGLQAVKIVDLLYNKKNINEFIIAKKLGITINQTRNLLYRLSHLGIISSTRKKDKRKGWYIYFWTFNVIRSLELLEEGINQEIAGLEGQLASKKQKRFYKCSICGREATEEAAMQTEFICQECGEVYALADNAPIIAETAKQIEHLRRELGFVESEIKKEREKREKGLVRFLKREAYKKKILRKKSRNARKAEKQRNQPQKKLDKKNLKKKKKKV
jgi:transcription factor E